MPRGEISGMIVLVLVATDRHPACSHEAQGQGPGFN